MTLSQEMIQKQKKSLVEEKAKLTEKIKELKHFPDYGDNEDDNAKELADFESNLSIEEQLELLIKKINKALEAIEDGTYGKCKKCNRLIETGRLEIMPYADVCVTCKKEED